MMFFAHKDKLLSILRGIGSCILGTPVEEVLSPGIVRVFYRSQAQRAVHAVLRGGDAVRARLPSS